jgi:NTP pyrophosphatase (non-canonical NTP hydrolase)
LHSLQNEVNDYIGQFKEGYFPPFEMLARMSEELGELAREVQQVYGLKKKKESEAQKSMVEELGDLLFVLICFANSQNIDMQQAHDHVMDKFKSRDKNRWTLKEVQE